MARVPKSVQDLPTGAEQIDLTDVGTLPAPAQQQAAAAAPPAPSADGGLEDISDLVGGSAPGPKSDGDISDLVARPGSAEGQASQFARSANRSLIANTPTLAGAVAGAKLGAAGGAFAGPPGALIGGIAGTVVGGVSGFLAGDQLADYAESLLPSFVSPNPERVPEDRRAAAYVGESFGGSIMIGGQVQALARTGATVGSGSLVGRLINGVLESARRTPGLFAAAEVSGATYAALGAGAAETLFPGDTGARTSAEIGAGFLSPARTLTTGSQFILNKAQNVALMASNALPESVGKFVPGAQSALQRKAKEALTTYLKETGTDIGALRRALNSPDIADLPLSAGQKTGDPALLALEVEFSRTNETFRKALARGGAESLETIRDLTVLMRATGDPALIRQAAVMREDAFNVFLAARLDAAREDAIRAAGRITSDTPQARETLSTELFKAMESALADSRAVERSLWEAIPKNALVDDAPLREAYESIRPRLSSETFDTEITKFVEQDLETLELGVESGRATIGDVLRFRSNMLDKARSAAGGSTPDLKAVRWYEKMADAALQALNDPNISSARADLPSGQGASALDFATRRTATEEAPEGVRDAIDAARSYSRALNDTFSRSFVGTTLQKTAGGGFRRAPESMLRHAVATGQDATARNMREISAAMDFVQARGELVSARETGAPYIRSEEEMLADAALVQDAQERAMRLAAAAAIDPTTNLPSSKGLIAFKTKYESTLKQFPEVVEAVDAAIASNDKLLRLTGRVKTAERIASRTYLRKITGSENPSAAISTILRGDFPEKHVAQLARFAQKQGPDYVEALSAALFDNALARATNSATGEVSLTRLRTALADPPPSRPGQPSILDMMQSNGLGTPEWHTKVRQFLGRASQVEDALKAQVAAADLLQTPDPTEELVLSVAGSALGGFFSRLGGGQTSLIAQGRGAAYMRNVFSRMPMGRTRDFLAQVLQDPKKMDALLDVPDSQRRAIELVRQVHGYILQAGLPPGEGVQQEPGTEREPMQ